MHLVPQAELDAHIVRHRIVSRTRPIESTSTPCRIRQTSFQLILPDRRLRRRRDESRIVIGADSVVVYAHVAIAATDLEQVIVHSAAAVPVARRPAAESARVDVVVAMAFLRVLDAAEAEAAAVADVLAESDGHEGVVGSEVAVERANGPRAVVVAAEIDLVGRGVCLADHWFESGYWCRVDGLSDLRLYDVGSAVHRGGRCGFGAVGDFHAAWEFWDETAHLFVDLRWAFGAVEAKRIRLAFLQNRTVGNLAKVVCGETVDCRIREDVLIPTVLEISVEAVARGITLRENEQAIRSLVWHVLNVVEDFKKDVWDLDRMARRADSIVNSTLVGNVRIVLLVQIPSVPAALKVDLSTHAIFAFCAVHVGFLDRLFIQAVETDSIRDGAARVLLGAVSHRGVVVAAC